ncbi:hypothetical protein [Nonomuraea sp. LPB2021202275-12-8]|uniref:hypothetical protein n=1 Tax=Nonomuraea sp. LPB2021202275-12-8 TaxID=3120159 RepID=UPI00300CAE4B
MNRKTGRGNRLGLALTGAVLTILGGVGLARGLGTFSTDWAPAGTPVVDGNVQDFFARTSPWIWWALAALSLVVALLALRWLLVQGRTDRYDSVLLEGGPGGVTRVTADGVAHALAADVASGPAVLSADASLAGSPRQPEVRLRLVADEHTPMRAITDHLTRVAIPHLRAALERERVPTVARVSLEPARAPQRMVR